MYLPVRTSRGSPFHQSPGSVVRTVKIMKLMPSDSLALLQPRSRPVGYLHIPEAHQSFLLRAFGVYHPAHPVSVTLNRAFRLTLSIYVNQIRIDPVHKKHESSALCKHRHPFENLSFYVNSNALIGLQPLPVQFRISPADIESRSSLREPLIFKRREKNRLESCPLHLSQVLFIVEAERLVTCHGQSQGSHLYPHFHSYVQPAYRSAALCQLFHPEG